MKGLVVEKPVGRSDFDEMVEFESHDVPALDIPSHSCSPHKKGTIDAILLDSPAWCLGPGHWRASETKNIGEH